MPSYQIIDRFLPSVCTITTLAKVYFEETTVSQNVFSGILLMLHDRAPKR